MPNLNFKIPRELAIKLQAKKSALGFTHIKDLLIPVLTELVKDVQIGTIDEK